MAETRLLRIFLLFSGTFNAYVNCTVGEVNQTLSFEFVPQNLQRGIGISDYLVPLTHDPLVKRGVLWASFARYLPVCFNSKRESYHWVNYFSEGAKELTSLHKQL